MNTNTLTRHTDEQKHAAQKHAMLDFGRAVLLFVANDTMPRTTTVYAADTELELERIAAWMNRYPLNLADRAKVRYGLIDIVSTHAQRQEAAHA